MLKIERSTLDNLGFDFDAALQHFSEQKKHHPFTEDVPAPTAHPLVEAAFAAAGFEVVENPPDPSPISLAPPPPNPIKVAALERLKGIPGKAVGAQLDEIRAVLTQMIEVMPG